MQTDWSPCLQYGREINIIIYSLENTTGLKDFPERRVMFYSLGSLDSFRRCFWKIHKNTSAILLEGKEWIIEYKRRSSADIEYHTCNFYEAVFMNAHFGFKWMHVVKSERRHALLAGIMFGCNVWNRWKFTEIHRDSKNEW